MVSATGGEKMDSLIQAIISPKSTQIDRLESYQTVLKCLQEDKEIPKLFVTNASKILSVLKHDISDDNTHVAQESLHFLGVFLHCERALSAVDKTELGSVLDELCSLLSSSNEKVVCTRALWCISKQKIPIVICVEKLDLLLKTIESTSKTPSSASTSMELEAIRVINRFLVDIPDSMTVRIKMWARRLYLATVHMSAKVREAAFAALLAARPAFQKQQSDVLNPLVVDLKELDLLLKTIESTSKTPSSASTSMELEAIRVINRFLVDIPDSMTVRIKMWARRLYLATVHMSAKVREAAFAALLAARPAFQKQQSDVLNPLVVDLKELLVPGMLRLFKEKQELHSLRLWNLLLDILGRTLHQGASLINNLLAVVEKAFKSFAPEVKIAAFKAWQQLITNFGSDLDVLANPKRLRLVMQPLKANNARTEQIAFTKFKVWWHLSVTLGAKLSPNLEMVVYPLFQFCFGAIDGITTNQPTSPGNASMNSSGGTPKLNATLNSSASSPSYQKYSSINRFGAEALAQILGFGLNLPVSCPSFTIASVGHHVLVPPSGFLRHSEVLMACAKEAIANLGTEKRDLHLQLYLWHALVSRIRSSAETDNRKEVSVAVTAFFRVLDEFIKSNSPSPEVMLKLLEISTLLPQRILNSSSYNIDNSSLMKGTPALFLLSLLFQPSLLKLSSSQERFMNVFKKLISSGMSSTATSLGFVEEVFKTLEASAEEAEPSDIVYRLWSTVVNQLLDSIQKTQEVNQGDSLEHDFRCMHAALIFPIQHLLNKPLLQNSLKTVLRIWGELYRAFSQCAALVPNIEANGSTEEFCAKLIAICPQSALLEDPLFLDSISHLLNIIVTTLDFSPSALQALPSKILAGTPEKWMQRKQNPLGNLASLTQLIEELIKSLAKVESKHNSSEDSNELSQQNKSCIFNATCNIIEALRFIFSHVTSSNVVAPLISTLASSMALLFQNLAKLEVSKVMQGQLMIKLEGMWNAASSCIQHHCTGPFDSSFLTALHPLLEATLSHQRRTIRMRARMLWHSTFEQSCDSLTIPESLKTILKKVKPSLIPGSVLDDAIDEPVTSPMEVETQDPFASQEEARTPQKGSFLRKYAAEQSPAKPLLRSAKPETPDISSNKRLRLDEISEKEFVKIAPVPKRRRVLTEHQKEVFSTLREVPAMYVDLSQDTAPHQPSQFADDTQTLTEDVFISTNNNRTPDTSDAVKENVEKHCFKDASVKDEDLQDSVVIVEESQVEPVEIVQEAQSIEVVSEKSTTDSVEIMHYEDILKGTVSLISDEAGSSTELVATVDKQGKSSKDTDVELDDISKHATEVINDGLIESSKENTNNSPSPKRHISNIRSITGDLELTRMDVISDVRVPEMATEDEKLWSQPVLEIKRLTSKDIIELSQPTVTGDLSDNSVDHSTPVESDLESKSQEETINIPKPTEIVTPKTKVKYVGKRKVSTGSITKAHPSISDEYGDDVIPSSQNSDSSSDNAVARVTRSKEIMVLQEADTDAESAANAVDKQDNESEDLEDLAKPEDKIAGEPVTPKKKGRLSKKGALEVVALFSDSRVTRSSVHSTSGRRRSSAQNVLEFKRKRGRPKKKVDNHNLSPEKPSDALKSASEESVDSEMHQDEDTDQRCSDAEQNYSAHEAQEGLASYSLTISSVESKPAVESLSSDAKPVIEETGALPEKTRRKSKGKKKSPETSPILEQSPTKTVRSRRQVKKSLKAKLAEETSNVLKKRNSTSDASVKTQVSNNKAKEKEAAVTAGTLDLDEDMSQVMENVEIENMQLPSASIDHLVKSPMVSSVEIEIEPVSLIVADMVEVSSKSEEVDSSVDPGEENVLCGESDKTQVPDVGSCKELTASNAIIANSLDIPTEDKLVDSGMEIDETTPINKGHTLLEDVSTEIVSADGNSCPDMFAENNLENSSLNKSNAKLEESIETTVSQSVEPAACVVTEPLLIPASDSIVTCDATAEAPITEMVHFEIEVNSVLEPKEHAKSEKQKKSSAGTKANKERSKSKSTRSSSSSSSSSGDSSRRGGKKQSTAKKRGSASPASPKKNLLRFTKPEDDGLKFIAQRNTKTYSREFHGQAKSPPANVEPLTSVTSKPTTNVSPLMQRTGSRAVKMLEAAAKNNLSKYEKMKYEQHRSPDKSGNDERSAATDTKTEVQRTAHPAASPQSSKSSISSVSPTISPSGGILKKFGTFPSLSTPSPVNKRRVSFADPLVQDKEEEWQQQSSTRGTVNRCLEMNKGLPDEALTQNGDQAMSINESATEVLQPCEVNETSSKTEKEVTSADVEELSSTSEVGGNLKKQHKNAPEAEDSSVLDHSAAGKLSPVEVKDAKAVKKKGLQITAAAKDKKSTIKKVVKETTVKLEGSATDGKVDEVVLETDIQEVTIPQNEVEESSQFEMETQETTAADSDTQKGVSELLDDVAIPVTQSENKTVTIHYGENEGATKGNDKIEEKMVTNHSTPPPATIDSNDKNKIVPQMELSEKAIIAAPGVVKETQDSVVSNSSSETQKVSSPCIEIHPFTLSHAENRTSSHLTAEESSKSALPVASESQLHLVCAADVCDNVLTTIVQEAAIPTSECAVDIEITDIATCEIPASTVKSNIDLNSSLVCGDTISTSGGEEIVETESVREVTIKDDGRLNVAAINPNSLRTEVPLSDILAAPDDVSTKVLSDDDDSRKESSLKLSPSLKRTYTQEVTAMHDLPSAITSDLPEDGEPEVKKRRVDLFRLTDELCALFTDENLGTLSGQKIMTLQERLCNMSLAVTSSLLKRSADNQSSPDT